MSVLKKGWFLLALFGAAEMFAASSGHAQAASPKASLFGLEIGLTEREAKERHPALELDGADGLAMEFDYKVGPITMVAIGARFIDGKIEIIMGQFHPKDFDDLADGLKAKFGPGREERSILQNGLGVQFEQVELEWLIPAGGFFHVSKYKGSFDKGWMQMVSSKAAAKAEAEIKAKTDSVKEGL
jgi:hypothetical protein